MVQQRYAPTLEIDVRIEERGPGVGRLQWEIDRSGKQTFTFDSATLRSDRDFRAVTQFDWICPLLFNYARSREVETGSVIINQWDLGLTPGLAYSDNRPDYFLIPDYIFVSTRGYQHVREHFTAHSVAWNDRKPVAFWRGATTGMPLQPDEWRSLERVRLCELAQKLQHTGMFDVGLSAIVQFSSPKVIADITNSGLMRGTVPWGQWNSYKYLIDIDGNSSPWSNLFQRLLSGSPVLKIQSYRGLRQWYYDDLVPWDNFVPIAPDASDLLEKVNWLSRHDSLAERIGRKGRDLALRLTLEAEMARSIPVIRDAFRYSQDSTMEPTESKPAPVGEMRRGEASSERPSQQEVALVCALLQECDVEINEYFAQYKDLARLGHDLPSIVQHLLFHGAAEGRRLPVRDPEQLKQKFKELSLPQKWSLALEPAIRNAIPSTRRYASWYLAQPGPHMLEIGAGRTTRPQWLATDLSPKFASDGTFVIALDAADTFPLPDSSFDFIYSEHMIEHVAYDVGVNMLRECHRVLKPGGVVRIATPSLGMLLRVMTADRGPLEERYFRHSLSSSVPNAPGPTNAFFVNNFMRNWGHTFIYDRETLRLAFEQAGFETITECEFGRSDYVQLRNLEHHERMPPGFLELETMTFEGIKE
jgi:predicted SAM-dependent methyltransferase